MEFFSQIWEIWCVLVSVSYGVKRQAPAEASSHYVPRTAAAALEFEPVPTPGLSMWKLGLSQQKKQTNPDVETPDICDKEARSNIEKETKERG